MSEVEHWKHCPSSDGGDNYCLVTPLNSRYKRACSTRECSFKQLIEDGLMWKPVKMWFDRYRRSGQVSTDDAWNELGDLLAKVVQGSAGRQ